MIDIKPHLKILILEDNPFDVILMKELIQHEIKEVEFYCVSNKEEYLQALEIFGPDIILSDNCFPQFTAVEALGILRERSSKVPFILVTGSVSEEFAVAIVKQGASDYILKDRPARLPRAIEAALNEQHKEKKVVDYKYALNQSAIVVITDKAGVITYVNENYCRISGYKEEELIGKKHEVLHNQLQQTDFSLKLPCTAIRQSEFLHVAKNGDSFWLDTIMIPFMDEKNEPYCYLVISSNISEKKNLHEALLEQQQNEQLKMMAIALAAQEKERNIIGQELHDNVNQVLVTTKLLLSVLIQRTDGGDDELLQLCNEHIYNAIEENRKIARVLVSPNLEKETLQEQLKMLSESMLSITGLNNHIDISKFNEKLLTTEQKLTVYRISQEQCTNIVKHAFAKNVSIVLETTDTIFKMTIADDGKGIVINEKFKGTGLKNIMGRIEIFNGTVRTISSPGCGFTLEIEMPLNNLQSPTTSNE